VLVLGLETSCDETAAAVVSGGPDVLSNVVASQYELHEEYGGVVPEIASRAHVERLLPVLRRAVSQAGVSLGDIGAVAVGHRPGLIGSLLVGVSAAKALAWSLGVPLVGVDHVHAHLDAGWLRVPSHGAGNPAHDLALDPSAAFPALGLVISGGHTVLYRLDSRTELSRLGSTIDDAVGEAYDKAAMILGLGHPGGPRLDALAATGNDRAVSFPTSRLAPDSLDFSFSGLKTAMLYRVRGIPGQPVPAPLDDASRADLAASFQRAAIGVLMLKIERAIEHLASRGAPPRTLIIGGGVSANSRLRRDATTLAARRGLGLVVPPMSLCTDNAAMIAGLGHALMSAGRTSTLALAAEPTTGA
jgi:N6-L-threonylcarbamoyladenine synthase